MAHNEDRTPLLGAGDGHSINDDREMFPPDKDGLTSAEAERRLAQYGLNAVEAKTTPTWKKFLLKFWGPMPILIEIAIILSAVNAILSPPHDWISFGVLLALLIVNGLIGFFEERNAGKAIEALKKTLAPRCSVRRDGLWTVVDSKYLVPGDLIAIKLGDIVPADCTLCEGQTLEVDESALTGESLPVSLNPGETAKSGGIIKRGETEAVVVKTGANTFIGEAMALVAQTESDEGNFQRVIFKMAKVLIVIALVDVVVIFLIKVFRDHDQVLPVIDLCLVLLVAAIPIAMQVVCTGTMAVGSRKLAQHKVIVSRLGAIEELAGMTVLCSDKTGTLTQNKLQMRDPFTLEGIDATSIIFNSALAAKRVNPDAIDTCILNAIPNKEELEDYTELDFLPFDPIFKRTEAFLRTPDGKLLKVSKGAPQVILNLVYNKDDIEELVDSKIRDFAGRGLRALGVARCYPQDIDDEDPKWEMLGILSFHDPPRHDTKTTIEKAIAMGADVKMITGDHLLIAKETARLLGMGQVFYGTEFLKAVDDGKSAIDGVDVSDIVEAADGFAQVSPKHKYFIVDQLQRKGHTTAMTGDGVNDAPALKKADIGIAVEGATEAAKSAADLVLLTPGLSVIITAVLRSRKIFQRMKNYCIYRIICTFQLLAFFTIAIIFLDFSIPTITLVILVLLNDGTIMTIAYDNVIPTQKPEKWKLHVLAGIACTVGSIATIGLFGMYFLYSEVVHEIQGTNFFGIKFNNTCYYAHGDYPGTNYSKTLLPKAECNPLCPTFIEEDRSCGDTSGWSEMISVIYMCLACGGQLTVYVARTKHSFWSRRPGYTLMTASLFAVLCSTFLSVYWPISLDITAYVGVVDPATGLKVPSQVTMHGCGWEMAGYVWVYLIILFLIEDLVKVYFYYSVDNDAKPDLDVQQIKKDRKPFLPVLAKYQEKKKRESILRKEKRREDRNQKEAAARKKMLNPGRN